MAVLAAVRGLIRIRILTVYFLVAQRIYLICKSRGATGGTRAAMSPKIWLSSTEGYKMLPKNVAALKTIFHITESLGHLLGEGWHIVLGTVNCLDCILAMPRTIASIQVTTQWRSELDWVHVIPHGHEGGLVLTTDLRLSGRGAPQQRWSIAK